MTVSLCWVTLSLMRGLKQIHIIHQHSLIRTICTVEGQLKSFLSQWQIDASSCDGVELKLLHTDFLPSSLQRWIPCYFLVNILPATDLKNYSLTHWWISPECSFFGEKPQVGEINSLEHQIDLCWTDFCLDSYCSMECGVSISSRHPGFMWLVLNRWQQWEKWCPLNHWQRW